MTQILYQWGAFYITPDKTTPIPHQNILLKRLQIIEATIYSFLKNTSFKQIHNKTPVMNTYLILEEKFFWLSDFVHLVSELNIYFISLFKVDSQQIIKKPINVNSNTG